MPLATGEGLYKVSTQPVHSDCHSNPILQCLYKVVQL